MYRKQVRRRRAVLTLLILGSFLLLTISYGHGSGSIQDGVSTIFSPLEGVADRALKPARDLVDWFDKTFEARGENSRLNEELEQARTQAVAGQEAIQENAQLRKLVELDRDPVIATSAFNPVTGRVIARSPTVWHSSVTIDLGSGDGVVLDDPVISGDGLVGEISAVQPNSSQVQLITDHASAVSAKVLPLGVQGVVRPVGRRPRGPRPRLHQLLEARRRSARPSSPRAGGPRAWPRCSRPGSRSGRSRRPRSSSRRQASRFTCDHSPTWQT